MNLQAKSHGEQQVIKSTLIRVGTRKSQLALIQTNLVINQLKQHYENNPDKFCKLHRCGSNSPCCAPTFEVVAMSTTGDQILDKPLPSIGTKSLFTRELEVALLEGRVDFVVHSLKDLPTTLPSGCVIGAVLKRDDPNDAIVLKKSLRSHLNPIHLLTSTKATSSKEKLKIGTSSHRRIAMLKRQNSELDCIDIRGNLNTRLKKLDDDEGEYAAIVLAKAGLDRMDWAERASSLLSPHEHEAFKDWCYAVGQGAMAVECRADDISTLNILSPVINLKTTYEVVAERSLMKKLGAGCSVPLGVRSSWGEQDEALRMESIVLALDGSAVVRAEGEVNLQNKRNVVKKQLVEEALDSNLQDLTGIVVPETLNSSIEVRENMMRCSTLGIEVANKMIGQGCLELMKLS